MKTATSARTATAKELSHDRLGAKFEKALSSYDTRRRVETLVDEFLVPLDIRGKKVLDVGCGLGFFSQRLADSGAIVTACDIGPSLVMETAKRVGCTVVQADALALTATFKQDEFDCVVSSECIEHTPDPQRAVKEMTRVLKPGGYLSLSTPNLLWYPVVRAATLLKLRPFDGYENFSTWSSLRSLLEESGMEICEQKGLHLFPFQFRLHRLSRWVDENAQGLRGCMINICLLARKI